MNVLFVDQFGEIGGAQLCLLDLIPAVREAGWRPYAAVPAEGPLRERLRDAGATVDCITPGHYASGRKRVADAIRYARRLHGLAVELDGLCAAHAIDLIYVNGPRLLPPVALGMYKAPVLFHAHSYIHQVYARRLAQWAIRRRRAIVVAVSRFVAAQFEGHVHVVPSGVADLRRERVKREIPHIGVLGRIAREKGQRVFVEAAKLLPGFRLFVFGSAAIADPEYEREVRRCAEGLPIEFTGWRDDVGAVLSQIDVLVVPSAGEGLGRVALEAFSAEVPVVAFASGGIPELIEDGVTGFLVGPQSAAALAAKIREVARMPDRLRTVTRTARQRWAANYTLKLYRQRMLEAMACAAESGPAVLPQMREPRQRTAARDSPGV